MGWQDIQRGDLHSMIVGGRWDIGFSSFSNLGALNLNIYMLHFQIEWVGSGSYNLFICRWFKCESGWNLHGSHEISSIYYFFHKIVGSFVIKCIVENLILEISLKNFVQCSILVWIVEMNDSLQYYWKKLVHDFSFID